MVAGYDSQPRKGKSPTSDWSTIGFVSDAILLPVNSDVPSGGGYKVEFGWYDSQTQQRLSVIDAQGHRITDAVLIGSFTIE